MPSNHGRSSIDDWRPGGTDLQVLQRSLAHFGRSIQPRLAIAKGSRENNIRGPFENLAREFAKLLGVSAILFGEEHYVDLGVRPDYVMDVAGRQVGVIELKAPGKGADPQGWSANSHDGKQWNKLQSLPNVLYTDGLSWGVYRDGQRNGPIVTIAKSVAALQNVSTADASALLRLLSNFTLWQPERPRSLHQVVTAAARLCGLLRDEVHELLAQESSSDEKRVFMRLAWEWRQMLFSHLNDMEFADAYAQTTTFALLLARVESIDLDTADTAQIARQLSKHHALMGKAFGVLTERDIDQRSVVLNSLMRVISAVDWDYLEAGDSENAYAYLYEHFLRVYDPDQRRKSGSYYTPAELVGFMVRFVDRVLRSSAMQHPLGLASPDLTIIDPAMGTGSYLDEIIRSIARTVSDTYGAGQVAPALREAVDRLIGFEKQAGPFSVAEMRLHRTLRSDFGVEAPVRAPRFLTDTLEEPRPELKFFSAYEAFEDNYEGAQRYKLDARLQVAISNPPFGDKAGGRGGFVERRPEEPGRRSLMDDFRSPGIGRHAYVLSSQVVYFWRWATWKVFDADPHLGAIIAFVSPSAFLHSPGFRGMREYLRRQADAGWVIDLTPEGHQPPLNTRLFPQVAQPLCVAIFARYASRSLSTPAQVSFTRIEGTAGEKLTQLRQSDGVSLDWLTCPSGWGEPFRPGAGREFAEYLELSDVFPWSSRGVTAGRTWVYAPEPGILKRRWSRLMASQGGHRQDLFVASRDRHLDSVVSPLPGQPEHQGTLREASGAMLEPVKIAYRAFDRQWLIPDNRLLSVPRSALWRVASKRQVFISEQHTQPLSEGPGALFESCLPDLDHYLGHHGGRVFPLYRDSEGEEPNVAPGLLSLLEDRLQRSITAEDLLAYVAGLAGHSSYWTELQGQSKLLSARLPLSAVPELWTQAVELGRRAIWLQTYGERFVDPGAGRPAGPPRPLGRDGPKVLHPIPYRDGEVPERLVYRPDVRELHLADGVIAPVTEAAFDFRVGDIRTVEKWFRCRQRHPRGRRSSELDDVVNERWTAQLTVDLLNLLNVLEGLVALEGSQRALLRCVIASKLIARSDLVKMGVLPVPDSRRHPRKGASSNALF